MKSHINMTIEVIVLSLGIFNDLNEYTQITQGEIDSRSIIFFILHVLLTFTNMVSTSPTMQRDRDSSVRDLILLC